MKEPETMFQFIPSWNISNNFPVIDHFPPDRKTSNNLVKQKKKRTKENKIIRQKEFGSRLVNILRNICTGRQMS